MVLKITSTLTFIVPSSFFSFFILKSAKSTPSPLPTFSSSSTLKIYLKHQKEQTKLSQTKAKKYAKYKNLKQPKSVHQQIRQMLLHQKTKAICATQSNQTAKKVSFPSSVSKVKQKATKTFHKNPLAHIISHHHIPLSLSLPH